MLLSDARRPSYVLLTTLLCVLGGPPIETWIGRKESKNAAPDNLLPDVRSSVPILLARFVDMGFNTRETMALIGAHTTSTQNFVDSNQAGTSQDSTPDVWDVKFYGETKNSSTPDG